MWMRASFLDKEIFIFIKQKEQFLINNILVECYLQSTINLMCSLFLDINFYENEKRNSDWSKKENKREKREREGD